MKLSATKPWREAATLIVAGAKNLKSTLGAATVIQGEDRQAPAEECRENRGKYEFDYDILMLRRSGKSSFMPNAEVFPGGSLDNADISKEWLPIFRDAGFPKESFATLLSNSRLHPSAYGPYRDENNLIPEVAFRICAIREMFEEVGLLLTRHSNKPGKFSEGEGIRCPTATHNTDMQPGELLKWQDKVHTDASNFLELCRILNCVPDIWALFEWSEWLGPLVAKKRFDTVFYITSLQIQPDTFHDTSEASEVYWTSPQSLLEGAFNGKCRLEPPQILESARIRSYRDINKLRSFYKNREASGITRYAATLRPCKDGVCILYPGDCNYPTEKNHLIGEGANSSGVFPPLDVSVQDILQRSPDNALYNRYLMDMDLQPFGFIDNVELDGHKPVNFRAEDFKSSKL